MDLKKIFSEIYDSLNDVEDAGKVADYIPELANISPDHFGVHLATVDGQHYDFGDSDIRFSIALTLNPSLSAISEYDSSSILFIRNTSRGPSGIDARAC